MSHEIAFGTKINGYRMASLREMPWHADETNPHIFQDPASIEEWIKAVEADVEIQARPISNIDGQQIGTHREIWRPMYNSDGSPLMSGKIHLGSTLGVVGKNWTPVQDYSLVEFFRPWIDAGLVTIETAGAIFDGKRFWVLAKINQDPVNILPDDPVALYITIINSHDGTMRVLVGSTTIRIVCKNTMSAALHDANASWFGVRHTKGVNVKLVEIQKLLEGARKSFDSQVERFKFLATHSNTSEKRILEFFRAVFKHKPAKEIPQLIEEKKEESAEEKDSKIIKDLMILTGEKGSSTWWQVFNNLTYWTTHMKGRSFDNRLLNMFVGDSAKLTHKALELAVKAAEGLPLQG